MFLDKFNICLSNVNTSFCPAILSLLSPDRWEVGPPPELVQGGAGQGHPVPQDVLVLQPAGAGAGARAATGPCVGDCASLGAFVKVSYIFSLSQLTKFFLGLQK